jgi:hypothetical protein
MTEAEWLVCDDPQLMLAFLRGQMSDRKLRHFAVACVARIQPLLTSPLVAEVVEAAERFADGLTSDEALQGTQARLTDSIDVLLRKWRAARDAGESEQPCVGRTYDALRLTFQVTRPDAREAAYYASSVACDVYAKTVNPGAASCDQEYRSSYQAEKRNQAHALRDLFGLLPFGPLPPFAPSVLAWSDATIRRLAQAIYDERTFDRMPILADALEDAGCTDRAILDHCRGPGPHVRGCWVVDLLLGRE